MTSKFHGCPLCRRDVAVHDLVGRELEEDAATLVAANTPGWSPSDGLCRECARRFTAALDELRRHGAPPGAILPTPLRLGAPERYRGRGITIAFLDSGFYAHPDLVEPENRILAYVDVTRTGGRRSSASGGIHFRRERGGLGGRAAAAPRSMRTCASPTSLLGTER